MKTKRTLAEIIQEWNETKRRLNKLIEEINSIPVATKDESAAA